MSTSSTPPQASSPAQTTIQNNTSTTSNAPTSTNTTTTTATPATMPLTISTAGTSATNLTTGSNSTSSNNNGSSSILNSNATAKNKSNLLAKHLNANNSSTTLIEQPTVNGTQNFCLKWNHHTSNLVKNLTEMVADQQIVDCTLACDGQSIKAHKLILAACSNYFKELFIANPCKHPIVILKDIKINEIRAIVDFMYRGEVNVSQNQLNSLLKIAEILRVKGLTDVIGCNEKTSEKPNQATQDSNATNLINKLSGLDSAVAAVAASLNGKILTNGNLNYDNLQSENLNNSTDQIYNNNLFNLASLSSLRMNNNLSSSLNSLNQLNNSTSNNILNLRDTTNQTDLMKRKKKRKRSGNSFNIYTNKQNNLNNQDGDQAISLVTTNKDNSENNDNSSNSCNSSNNSTDNSTINNSLRNLCYIKKEQQQLQDQNESDGNCSGDESNDTRMITKDLLNVIAAANVFQQGNSNSVVSSFYRSSTPESNQNLLAIRRKLMQQQFNTLSPKAAQDMLDSSDNSNWIQSRQMVEASLIESYDDNEEEMIDVRPIVSFDEGSSNVPNSFNTDQMVMNSLDMNSMSSNPPTVQSGKICVCHLCNLTFTAHSSLRRHMTRHCQNRERYECDICFKSYSRKDYLKEHKKLKHTDLLVPSIAAN